MHRAEDAQTIRHGFSLGGHPVTETGFMHLVEELGKDFEQSIERPVDIVFPYDAKLAAQAAKLGKPMAEVAGGKMSAPFNSLSNMVLSHASDEGAAGNAKAPAAAAKSLVDNLKSMLSKPKDKAAA